MPWNQVTTTRDLREKLVEALDCLVESNKKAQHVCVLSGSNTYFPKTLSNHLRSLFLLSPSGALRSCRLVLLIIP